MQDLRIIKLVNDPTKYAKSEKQKEFVRNFREVPEVPAEAFDEIGQIIAYESGELGRDDVFKLFQHLIDNGHAWSLQGRYGRTAQALIDAGYCQPKR